MISRISILTTVLIFLLQNSEAQSLYKDITTNKVTLVQKEQVLVFFYSEKSKITKKFNDRSYHWYSGGQLNHNYGGYSGKLLDGSFNAFYLNKNLKETGVFRNGLKNGEWKNWYVNGQLMDVTKWKKGKKNGNFYEFNESGEIKRIGRYKDGKLSGKIRSFLEVDSVTIGYYKKGILKPQIIKVKEDGSKVIRVKKYIANKLKFKKEEEETF
jgi:antitoxin component YwqK of YwqJK toxin-antitoxin module